MVSPRRFLSLVFIIFICENESSTDAVPTGMVRQAFARVLKLGHTVSSIELVDNSFNCSLPARASEQGNVIGSVRIYMCVPKKLQLSELGI